MVVDSFLKEKWEINSWARRTAKEREQGSRRRIKDNHSKVRRAAQAWGWAKQGNLAWSNSFLQGREQQGLRKESPQWPRCWYSVTCRPQALSRAEAGWSRAVKENSSRWSQKTWIFLQVLVGSPESKLTAADLDKPEPFWIQFSLCGPACYAAKAGLELKISWFSWD